MVHDVLESLVMTNKFHMATNHHQNYPFPLTSKSYICSKSRNHIILSINTTTRKGQIFASFDNHKKLVRTLCCHNRLFDPIQYLVLMMSSKSNRNRDGSSSSSSSSMSESTIVLLIAVAMVSFFAGTIFTVHMNMDCVGGGIRDGGLGEQHHINVKVEELAQKRILGMYIMCR